MLRAAILKGGAFGEAVLGDLPKFEKVFKSLHQLDDATLLDWLLVYKTQAAHKAPQHQVHSFLKELGQFRVLRLYSIAAQVSADLHANAGLPLQTRFASFDVISDLPPGTQPGKAANNKQQENQPLRLWHALSLRAGPIAELLQLPYIQTLFPETKMQRRLRLQKAEERACLMKTHGFYGAELHTCYCHNHLVHQHRLVAPFSLRWLDAKHSRS
jgi:hypothetical protein